MGALMSLKITLAKCPSYRELLKTKCRQSFSLPCVNRLVVVLEIDDMLHLPVIIIQLHKVEFKYPAVFFGYLDS